MSEPSSGGGAQQPASISPNPTGQRGRSVAPLFLVLTVLGSTALLMLNVWPGSAGVLLMGVPFAICLSLPLLLVGGWLWLGLGCRSFAESNRGIRLGVIAVLTAMIACFLALADIPRRIAFSWERAEFEALLQGAPAGYGGKPLNRQLGLYFVDQYAADEEGGVWFRTAAHADGIGPDLMSYGFVYRPSYESCPFGRSKYHVSHLIGEWYSFSVSND